MSGDGYVVPYIIDIIGRKYDASVNGVSQVGDQERYTEQAWANSLVKMLMTWLSIPRCTVIRSSHRRYLIRV